MNILGFLLMKKYKHLIKEREAKAKSFWKKVSDAEKIFGRELTNKEIMSAMQRGMWPCAYCYSILSAKDKTGAYCPTCGLEFRLKDGKIQTKRNMSKECS